MTATQALAVWKSIQRHHPFFRDGGTFGWDFRTFHVCDPCACTILKEAIRVARQGGAA